MASGATPKIAEETQFYSTKDAGGIPFIRVQNLSETSELKQDSIKYINAFTHNIYLKRSQVAEGNLLTKITGVGRMAVSSVAPIGFIGNINQHIVVSKTKAFEDSEVLAAYLNSDIGEKLATRRATGGTRPALDYPALRSIPIVYNPEIVAVLKNGVGLKNQREERAKELLSNIDSYLLELLDIHFPTLHENNIRNRIFKTNWQKVTGNRLDPNAYQNKYEIFYNILKSSKYPLLTTKEICTKIFQGIGKDEIDCSNNVLLKVKNIQKHNRIDFKNTEYVNHIPQFKILRDGDIISPFIGEAVRQIKFATFKKPSPKNYTVDNNTGVIRPNLEKVLPGYLVHILNSIIGKNQIEQLIGGGGVPFIGSSNAKKFLIPIPDLITQKRIADEVDSIINESEKLKSEAQLGFEQTKKEIEKLILE